MTQKPKASLPTKTPTVRAFVYGTLKRGFPLNRGWMDGAIYVRDGLLSCYTLISFGRYPAMVYAPSSAGFKVKGEVFDIPEDKFNELRQMEESAGYTTKDVTLDDGTKAKVFVFATLHKGEVEWTQDPDKWHGQVSTTITDDDIPFEEGHAP